jgi:hypothetical protein
MPVSLFISLKSKYDRKEMLARFRLVAAGLVLGGILAVSLLGAVSSTASVAAKGRVVSAKLSPKKSFAAAQAKSVRLKCRFSPATKRAVFLLQMKKSGKWAKLRSVTKKGPVKKYTTTVKKLFGSKPVKAGSYRVKISADANSLTRLFTIKSPSNEGTGDGTRAPRGDDEEGADKGDGEEEPPDDSGGDSDPGGSESDPPGAFNKLSPDPGSIQPSDVHLTWSVSANANYYRWCVSKTAGSCSGWFSITGTTLSAASNCGCAGWPAGNYFWQVKAVREIVDEETDEVVRIETDADGGSWSSFTIQ